MPTIKLTHNEKIDVSQETVERVNQEWKNGSKIISIGDNRTVKSSRIIGIDFEIQSKVRGEYDLVKEEDKRIIKEFEEMLKRLETESLKYPLEFYGEPKEKIPAIEIGKRKFPENIKPRRVYTDVTGLIDAGVVQYLLRIKAISKRYVTKDHPGRSWAVGPDLVAYEDYNQKKRALSELLDKRNFAEAKEKESINALVESKESLSRSMSFDR